MPPTTVGILLRFGDIFGIKGLKCIMGELFIDGLTLRDINQINGPLKDSGLAKAIKNIEKDIKAKKCSKKNGLKKIKTRAADEMGEKINKLAAQKARKKKEEAEDFDSDLDHELDETEKDKPIILFHHYQFLYRC